MNRLDARLDALRPTETEEPSDSPVGRAWDALLGTVVRTTLRADELLEAAEGEERPGVADEETGHSLTWWRRCDLRCDPKQINWGQLRSTEHHWRYTER